MDYMGYVWDMNADLSGHERGYGLGHGLGHGMWMRIGCG